MNRRKLLALSLAVVLCLGLLPTTAGAFTKQTIAPDKSNSYYYSNVNPYFKAGFEGQCTWYAWGRAHEIMGESPTWTAGSASEWYESAKSKGYSTGTTPKVGAIACWDDWNHVAVVEEVKSNGNPVCSQANRQGNYFKYEEMTTKTNGNGKIVGLPDHYIYLIDDEPQKTTITFTSLATPGTLTAGQDGSLDGSITATNSKINSVTAEVINAATGSVALSAYTGGNFSVWTYGPIKGSKLDSDLNLGKLSAGTYYVRYTATTQDGTSQSERTADFTVNPKPTPVPVTETTPTPAPIPSTSTPTPAPAVTSSATPSSAPSETPSSEPSAEPIEIPSSKPIVTPSATPSSEPSATPSTRPSATPSARPSTSSSGGEVAPPPATAPVERDFTDWAQVQHKNAVAGCSDLGIINGLPDGSFAPAGNIDRASWAKMVYYAATGNSDAGAYFAIPVGLDDIQGTWAESYITYLALNNIVAGDGTGNFRPNRNVTVVEACKIMLTILGYDADERGYQNNAAWAENIMTDAYGIGLMKNVDPDQSATASLTRDNAAEIMYNALRATTRTYYGGSYTVGDTLVFEVFGVRPDQLP